jgi:hypothetical protein
MSGEDVANGFRTPTDGYNNPPYMNGSNTSMKTSFAFGPGPSNVALVSLTMTDSSGNPILTGQPMIVWLSDVLTGIGLTTVTASGAVVAGIAGVDFGDLTAKKAKVVQPSVAGVYQLSITDTAKTGFFVCVKNPFTGQTTVSRQLTSADYG